MRRRLDAQRRAARHQPAAGELRAHSRTALRRRSHRAGDRADAAALRKRRRIATGRARGRLFARAGRGGAGTMPQRRIPVEIDHERSDEQTDDEGCAERALREGLRRPPCRRRRCSASAGHEAGVARERAGAGSARAPRRLSLAAAASVAMLAARSAGRFHDEFRRRPGDSRRSSRASMRPAWSSPATCGAMSR